MQERAISLGILIMAVIYLAGSISLKVGTMAQPGPGFMPALVATLLLIAASFHAYQCFRERSSKEDQTGWMQLVPLGIAVTTIAYPFILRSLNFLLSTFIVLFVLLRLLRYKSALTALILATFTTLIAFIAFSRLLGVVLPAGPLEDSILRSL